MIVSKRVINCTLCFRNDIANWAPTASYFSVVEISLMFLSGTCLKVSPLYVFESVSPVSV